MAWPGVPEWTRTRTEQTARRFEGRGRLLVQINYLAFSDSANVIEVQAPLALGYFGIDVRAPKSIHEQGNGEEASAAQRNR